MAHPLLAEPDGLDSGGSSLNALLERTLHQIALSNRRIPNVIRMMISGHRDLAISSLQKSTPSVQLFPHRQAQ